MRTRVLLALLVSLPVSAWAANPAASIRAAVQAARPGATIDARGNNWIRHKDGDTYILDVAIGSLHVQNSTTEINTDWVADSGAWQYKMTTADFQAHARSVLNAGDVIEYRQGSSWVTFQPLSLNWINQDLSRQQIAITSTRTAEVDGDILRWPNAYGTGRHLQFQIQTARIQKLLTIDSAANLPTPTVSGTIYLEQEFVIKNSADVELYIDGVKWARTNGVRVRTSNRIEFRDEATGTQVLWVLDFPRVWDSSATPKETFGELEVRRQGGANYFITVRVPKTWIDEATFPIYIDPTIDKTVAAGNDDGRWFIDSSVYFGNTDAILTVPYAAGTFEDGNIWARFTGISGLSGATISSCTLILHANDSNNSGAPVMTISAVDAAAPSAPSSAADAEGRSRTTANVNWNLPVFSVGQFHNTPSLVSVIQELADSYDPSVIMIYVEDASPTDNGARPITAYESSTVNAPQIHIEYTAGGGGGGDAGDTRSSTRSGRRTGIGGYYGSRR